jgi:acetyl esterase/lipase
MAHVAPGELRRFNAEPIDSVTYSNDIDYVGDGVRQQGLDVIAPKDAPANLPVYVYFHGGGWTSGDKAALTRYCAIQAAEGMVVVNVNYRMAPRFRMQHMLQDANAAVAWVRDNIADYGGDPTRVVLGGDSAGGQIAALIAASATRDELAAHYQLAPVLERSSIRGVVLHCSAVDFSVIFERGFILGLGFVRMLLPRSTGGDGLRSAARYLSPIEWVGPGYPAVLVTTSRLDPFYAANLNFMSALRRHGVTVQSLINWRAQHTWQQDTRHPDSLEVYRKLQQFVATVTGRATVRV